MKANMGYCMPFFGLYGHGLVFMIWNLFLLPYNFTKIFFVRYLGSRYTPKTFYQNCIL
jgi:hypothetical protein